VSKSFVGMERHICVVCAERFETGNVLLHKRMQPVFGRTTVTGYGMCPKHQKLKDDGFIALIECDPNKTKVHGDTHEARAHLKDAYRTGRLVHMRATAFAATFDVPIPEKGICFIEPDVFAMLEKMSGTQADGETLTGTP
jgi:hypothetical protein